MKERHFVLPFVLFLAMPAPSGRAEDRPAPKARFRTEASSSAEERREPDGTWVRRTVRSRFDFVSASAWAGVSARLLLAEKFVREERSDREGTTSRLEVTALKSGAKPYDTTVWTLKTAADEIVFSPSGDFLETLRHGCCGAEDLHQLVDLETGRTIAAFSGKPAFLTADDRSLDRVVSYLSMMAAHEDVVFPEDRGVIGVLSLAGRSGPPRSVLVTRTHVEDMGTPKILVKGPGDREGLDWARLAAAKKGRAASDAVGGVTVILDWGDGLVATIPVARDGFDLPNAAWPTGFQARK